MRKAFRGLTRDAAPPVRILLMKMPKSIDCPSVTDVLPFSVIPRPADDVSFNGISKVMICGLFSFRVGSETSVSSFA